MDDTRLQALRDWLARVLPDAGAPEPVAGDASFRRYFRVRTATRNLIVMDAPPTHEDTGPFIDVARRLLAAGVHVPEVLEADTEQGFLLLTDLGDTDYLSVLDADTAERLYADAGRALLRVQRADSDGLPPYDAPLLQREMALFRDWFLGRHLGIALDDEDAATLQDAFDRLEAAALEQPRVFVHRDWHSRNLMYCPTHNPGVLDFQDAVLGPVTYDLVSLLRDCYIAWPAEQTERRALDWRDRAVAEGLLDPVDDATFLRWFDLMGAQRHLKAIGIFARLNHRDGKPRYLADIPRTLGHLLGETAAHPETRPLHDLLRRLRLRERLAA